MSLTKLSPNLQSILDCQLEASPSHQEFLQRRFTNLLPGEAEVLKSLADRILKIAGDDLATYCADYDWLTQRMLEEELYFRRHGRYRLTSFEDACAQVYHDAEFMKRYMNGVLLTQLFWSNHTRVHWFVLTGLLARSRPDSTFLEIGPGHGLYLAEAAEHPNVATAFGWDISPTSLQETQHALGRLGVQATLRQQDVLQVSNVEDRFDLILISEVLEHLEDPVPPLQNLRGMLKPDGLIFVQVPVNSPAPDHLFLWETPEDAVAFVEGCGLAVVEEQFHPVTNATLSRARKHKMTISVGVVARAA